MRPAHGLRTDENIGPVKEKRESKPTIVKEVL